MARPREFDDDAVSVALKDVFWKNGYDGTSYQDIMAATGLKKGSLYAAYGDKRALYLHAIERYNQDEVKAGADMLARTDMTATEKINALLSSVIETAGTPRGRWGCLLCNAAIDQAPFHGDTQIAVSKAMHRLEAAIAQALKPGCTEKAAHILAAYFGMRVMVKAGMPKNTLIAVRDDIVKAL